MQHAGKGLTALEQVVLCISETTALFENFMGTINLIPQRDRFTWDFPGGPVVKTLRFHCGGHGFNPWSGN